MCEEEEALNNVIVEHVELCGSHPLGPLSSCTASLACVEDVSSKGLRLKLILRRRIRTLTKGWARVIWKGGRGEGSMEGEVAGRAQGRSESTVGRPHQMCRRGPVYLPQDAIREMESAGLVDSSEARVV